MTQRLALIQGRTIVSLHEVEDGDPFLLFKPEPPVYKIELTDDDFPKVGDSRDPYPIIRMTMLDFYGLLTDDQLCLLDSWRQSAFAIPLAEIMLPINAMFRSVRALFLRLDSLGEFIELNHPDTIKGINAFAFLGVYGNEPVLAAAETTRILAGVKPL